MAHAKMRRLTTLLLVLLVLLLQGLPARLLAQSAPVLSSVTQQAFVAPVVVASSGFTNPTNVVLIANKIPGVSITISGTFTGLTATVQGRKDNSTAFSGPLTLIAPDGSSTTTSLSGTGTWNIDTSGQQAIQLNITALSSGNAVVSFGGVAVAQSGGTVVIGAVTQGTTPWVISGNVGAKTVTSCVPLTVTTGNAYGVNFVVGGLIHFNSPNPFTATGSGRIQAVTVTFKDAELSGFTFIPFTSNPSSTTFTDAAVAAINAADVPKVRGPVALAGNTSLATTLFTVYYAYGLGLSIAPGTPDLYGVLLSNSTLTNNFANTGDVQVCVTTEQDA